MATEHERGATGMCRAIEAICNGGELAAADALFTPDYVNHGGLIPDLVRGPEALKVAVALYRAAFPDFQVTMEVLRASGATVLLRWTASRHLGGATSDGATAEIQGGTTGITRGRLVGGRIAESWTHWDAPAPYNWGSSRPGRCPDGAPTPQGVSRATASRRADLAPEVLPIRLSGSPAIWNPAGERDDPRTLMW